MATEGPVLIIAGPGTGKTFTVVKRIAHLILDMGVSPEEIMAVTFTKKAARELVTRVSDELCERGGTEVNVTDMYIGTFHEVCLRIMRENEKAVPGKVTDAFEAAYLVSRNMETFEYISGFRETFPPEYGCWRRALKICEIASRLREELTDKNSLERLACDKDPEVVLLYDIVTSYGELLGTYGRLDFSAIQTSCLEMLRSDGEYLEKLREKIKYIMVDEYQDTNFIQEQLIFLLAGERKNICVVGDDDQGMYRFRGATIRNILEFPEKFKEGECRRIYLDVNYRSKGDIINFCSRFMENAEGVNLFNWDKFRFEKHLVSGRTETERAVFTCGGRNGFEQGENILKMINRMRREGYITDLNQIAFLFRSVKGTEARELGGYLEENGIAVYSPRSKMFFERTEVKQITGCMIMCFGTYLTDLKRNSFTLPIHEKLREYYKSCVGEAAGLFKENALLHEAVRELFGETAGIKGNSDMSLLGIFYRLMSFEPFKSYLDVSLEDNAGRVRAARNLSEVSRMLSKFSLLHNMQHLTGDNKVDCPEQFFNEYLKYLYIDGIGEYEDISEFAPKGCVSFMTVHQAKGLEFPVTVVCSLGGRPRRGRDDITAKAQKYFSRPPYEPLADIKYFDFWRLYYTAFSRARDMLVLSERTDRAGIFSEYTRGLPEFTGADLGGKKAAEVKKARYKNIYSFTSHIAVYEDCPRQYKFYKELRFAPPEIAHTFIGSLVHETLEEINNTVISGKGELLREEKIREIYNVHLVETVSETGCTFTDDQKTNALGHVLRYCQNRGDEMRYAYKAEEKINLVMEKFILQGVVDLLEYYENDDVFEILDYKTGPKPDIKKDPRSTDHYRKQMEIYAFLIERRYKKPVRRMKLYYTGETAESPYIIFDNDSQKISGTIADITRTVEDIESKRFEGTCGNGYTCRFCGMRGYCSKQEK
ncbi:MAG: ATP-dependent helicase [Ruminococcus sp.]|nr:ATP-dependent helicase [Ruminococcus sp.]